jgi:hypothetical protein
MRIWLVALAVLTQVAAPPQAPQAEIVNSRIRAKLYLPDAQSGYYRGTRFDWSGAIHSLAWNGHEYFGQWFEKYDPKLHDAITGPVEEFLTGDSGLGYEDAKPGETFVRIGVGAVRKPQEAAYRRFETYEIVDPGTRRVDKYRDAITFVHELSDKNSGGYAYVYTKKLRLDGNKLVLDHTLKNTGRKPIATSVYNHNFFTLDSRTTGPEFAVRFRFAPKAVRELKGLAEVKGNEIAFLREFERGQTVFTEVEGFGSNAADYDIRIENRKSGAGVHITGDRPFAKLLFWSAVKTVCPEPYIDASVEPGKETTWRITYEFYDVPKIGTR